MDKMSKGFISAENTIIDFESSLGIKDQFKSLYMYAMYVCGGDFESFDDTEKMMKAIMDTEEKFKCFEL